MRINWYALTISLEAGLQWLVKTYDYMKINYDNLTFILLSEVTLQVSVV